MKCTVCHNDYGYLNMDDKVYNITLSSSESSSNTNLCRSCADYVMESIDKRREMFDSNKTARSRKRIY